MISGLPGTDLISINPTYEQPNIGDNRRNEEEFGWMKYGWIKNR